MTEKKTDKEKWFTFKRKVFWKQHNRVEKLAMEIGTLGFPFLSFIQSVEDYVEDLEERLGLPERKGKRKYYD